jgi:Fe-S-cluster containining protein
VKKFLHDLSKYGLDHLETMELRDYTDDDIKKLTGAFAAESIAPSVPSILFEKENVKKLLNVSKCRRCGRCCLPDKTAPDNPGVIVGESDLIRIGKNTKHSLKSLKKIVKVNQHPSYHIGATYLPLPCMFFNKSTRSCKIYTYRPLICRIYPVSDDSGEDNVTIDVHCDYGKEIFQKALKYLREEARKQGKAFDSKSTPKQD